MDTETLVQSADRAIYQSTGEHLKDLQVAVLRGSLEQRDYKAIARETGKTIEHVRKMGSHLWKQLSQALGEPITKTNCRETLRRTSPQFSESASSAPSVVGSSPPSLAPHQSRQDWGEAPDVPVFLGREPELQTLRHWILTDRCRFISIVGLRGIGKTAVSLRLGKGGIGKTELSLKLAQGIQDEFEFVIWRSLLNAPSISDLLTDWIQVLSQHQANPAALPLDQQIRQLLDLLKQNRCLLILDNAETILGTGDQTGQYRLGSEDYGPVIEKLATVPHQSCILLTSREKLTHLTRLEGPRKPVRILELGGLTELEGRQLFAEISDGFYGSAQDWQQIIHFYDGNPLALELAAHHIKDVFNGDLHEFLSIGKPLFSDLRELLDWHCDRLSLLEQEVLYWLAIRRNPSSLADLRADLVSASSQHHLPQTLQSLQQKLPLEKSSKHFSLQPVLIEYFTDKLIATFLQEIKTNQLNLLNQHALIQADAKDYVRETQTRLILTPIRDELLTTYNGQFPLEQHIQTLLRHLQTHSPRQPGYSAGNLFNLLTLLGTNLQDYDFSRLALWQANFQQTSLHSVNFTQADFHRCLFRQSFGGIHSLAFSPDGQTLAVGDSNGQIRLLTADGSRQLGLLQKHLWWTISMAFSPDSQKLVSSSLTPTLKLWDIQTQRCLHDLEGHREGCWSVAFSPDGHTIASGSDDRSIKLWDTATGQCRQTLTGHSNWVLCVAFHPHRPFLASSSYDATIKLWDLTTGQCLQTLTGHSDAVWSIALSPSGDTLASTGCDTQIKLWDLNWDCILAPALLGGDIDGVERCQQPPPVEITIGTCQKTLMGHPREVKTLALSPDGKTLASACFSPMVRFWSVATGTCNAIGQGHVTGIRNLAFSPDNRTVVTGDNDQVLKFWDAQTGKCLKTLTGHTNWLWSVVYSPDGKTIAACYLDHNIRLWDAETGQCLHVLQGHTAWIWSIAFSPDGNTLASSGDDITIRLWNVQTGEAEQCLRYASNTYQGGIWAIAFSPDGQFLISGGQDPIVKRWDLNTGNCIQGYRGHQAWVWSVAYHPHGRLFASSSDDHSIRLWDSVTGECLWVVQGHGDKVRAIAFSADGRWLVSGSDDASVKQWDVATGTCVQTLMGHQGWIFSVAMSRCGNYIVSGSNRTCTLRLWDATTGKCLQICQVGDRDVTSVDIHPDSQTMISGSLDGLIRSWDVTTGHCVKVLKVPHPYESMQITQATGLGKGQQDVLLSLGAFT